MMKIIQQFKASLHHPFSHDVATLQVGSLLGRIFAFATSLIFARILGPEDYGFYALVFALAGIITIFQDFGAGQGVTNLLARALEDKNKTEIKSLLAYFVKMTLIVLVTTGLAGIVLAPWLGLWFYQDFYLGQLASIVVATTALTLFFPLIQITLQVVRQIKKLTILETLNKLIANLLPIILIVLGLSVFGIVIGQFVAMLIISIIALFVYLRLVKQETILPKLKELFTTKLSWDSIKYYFSFGFLIAISKNLVKLNTSVPLLILAAVLATNSGLAFYKIAFAYMSLPIVLLGPISRLLNVQFPHTAHYGNEQLFKRFWQVNWITLLISLILTVGAVILGPWLIKLFYGTDFIPSIKLMYGLSLYPLVSALGVGLGPMFRTLNKMKAAIVINIITFVLLVPSAWWLISSYSIMGLIIVTVVFTFIPNFISLIYFYNFSRKDESRSTI